MSTATALIHKPKTWKETSESFSIDTALHTVLNSTYLRIWLVFYLNITCGLALIAFEKDLAQMSNITWIGLLAALTAMFNTLGRFGYSTASDWIKDKTMVYVVIFATSAIAIASPILIGASAIPIVTTLCIVNAGYGGGFSTLPTLLESKFGMKRISMIHGFALSAWGWAGLSGNQLSNVILNYYHGTFNDLLIVICALYMIALLITITIAKEKY